MLGKKSAEQINAKISSIIGADMVVDGDIRAKEAVRVEGSVTGDVETEGALIISSSGKVKENVKGQQHYYRRLSGRRPDQRRQNRSGFYR